MKIKITYEEESQLQHILDALKPVLGGLKVHKSDTYKPYKHAYVTPANNDLATK